MNSGSYFILLILISVSFYTRRFVNFLCSKIPQFWFVRSFAIYIHEKREEPIEMLKAAVKLF